MARSSDGATVVNLDVNFIRWGPRDKTARTTWCHARTAGYSSHRHWGIYANVHLDSRRCGSVHCAGVGVLADGLVAMTPTMNAEAVWQATIVTNDRVVMKLQEPVYIPIA